MPTMGAKFNYIALTVLLTALMLVACDAQTGKPSNSPNQALTATTMTYIPPLNTGVSNWMPAIPTDASGRQLITPWPTDDGPLDTPTTPPTLSPEQKIAADLTQAMTANPNDISFIVILVEQANAESGPGGNDPTSGYEREKGVADRTQPPVKAALDALKQQGQVTSYQSFWLANGFSVKGTAVAVTTLAKRPDISRLELDSTEPANGYHKPIPVDTAPPSSTETPHQLYNSAVQGGPKCCSGVCHTPQRTTSIFAAKG